MDPNRITPPRSRLSRPHDARALKSRKALREALLRLLEAKPITQVQIKELTAEAGVSYPVFFRQFSRIEEIVDEVATAEVQALLSRLMPKFDVSTRHDRIRDLCDYVQEHRALWSQLLMTDAATTMRAEFARQADQMRQERGQQVPELPADLVNGLVVGGIFEVLTWWLRQPADVPAERVAGLLSDLVIDPIYSGLERRRQPNGG